MIASWCLYSAFWFSFPGVFIANMVSLTGDLTKPVAESGLFQQFTLLGSRGRGEVGRDEGVEMALGESVSLEVGQDGIIGRRVSVTRRGVLLADGIVGFNFGPSMSASL